MDTYEKKFIDFLDKMQGLLDNAKKQGHIIVRVEDLENALSEFVESKDERIRKALIRFHKSTIDVDGIKGEDIIAWLKKQCEKKSANNSEPKFKVGDCIMNNITLNSCHIIKVEHGQYICDDCSFPITKENDYHLWTIQDAKDGDVLEFGDHGRLVTGILSFVNKTTGKVDVSCLLEGDKFKVGVFYNLDTVKPHPVTKEQRDLLFQKMHEAGYEWDEEKKELKRIEQVDCFDAEPKESKDEMIRKGITKSILNLNSDWLELCGVTKEDALVWLENQGEQKAILDELEMTLSVSEDGYLRENIEKLIKELKTNKQQ